MPERVFLVPDHFAPNKDILSAEQVNVLRVFGREMSGVHERSVSSTRSFRKWAP